jgi:isochorismate hydrolase
MKEIYFTEDSIGDLSSEWLAEYARSRKIADQPFDIHRAGLLILDMQEYFLNADSHAYIPSGRTIIPGLNKLAASFRSVERPVIATQHINSPEDAGMMASWWAELITGDHALVNLSSALDIKPDEILIKNQYDAFFESSLKEVLDVKNVEQLVIGGVMTHLCCETTARSGFVQGYEIFFLVDGTATYNREYHLATLRNLAHGIAVLTTSESLLGEE